MTPDTIRLPRETVEAVKEALIAHKDCADYDLVHVTLPLFELTFTIGDLRKAAAALALLEQELKDNG